MYYQPSSKFSANRRQRQSNRSNRAPHTWPKIYWWLLAVVTALAILVYWLFFSASWRLTVVEVGQAGNFDSSDIQAMAWDTAHESSWLPGDNLWLFNRSVLRQKIEAKYYLDNLQIKLRPPHKITVSFQEKNYGLIWQEGNGFFYINYQGDIIAQKNEAVGNVTLLVNRAAPRQEGRRIKIEEKYLRFADELDRAITQNSQGLTPRTLFIDDEFNTVNVQISGGPILKFSTEEGIDKQLTKLASLRRWELSDGRSFNSQHYIDLRYGDRVFYQ